MVGISSRRRTLQKQTILGRRDSIALVGNSSRRRTLRNQTIVPLPLDSAIVFVPRPSTVLGLGSLLDGTVKYLSFLFSIYLIFSKGVQDRLIREQCRSVDYSGSCLLPFLNLSNLLI